MRLDRVAILLFAVMIGGMSLVWLVTHRGNSVFTKPEYEAVLRFSYTQKEPTDCALQDVGLYLTRKNERMIRALKDCFQEWEYGSQVRSCPFYLKVIEKAATKEAIAKRSPEELHAFLKAVRFEIEPDASAALSVKGRVVIRADGEQLAKELAAIYEECLSNYVSEANVELEERATSALRGNCLALERSVAQLVSRMAIFGLRQNERGELEREIAKKTESLGRIRNQIEMAKMSAREFGRCIVFPEKSLSIRRVPRKNQPNR